MYSEIWDYILSILDTLAEVIATLIELAGL